jgi:hypothetical protein
MLLYTLKTNHDSDIILGPFIAKSLFILKSLNDAILTAKVISLVLGKKGLSQYKLRFSSSYLETKTQLRMGWEDVANE